MSRPTDHLQPSGKRRPGEQLTKDNAGDSDEEGPSINPGTWGKADQATMARRKVVRARRTGGAAEPAPAAEDLGNEQAAGSNPFAGVSLTTSANPFAGVSIVASAKPQEAATAAAATTATPEEEAEQPAAKLQAAQEAADSKAAEQPVAAAPVEEQKTPVAGDGEVKDSAAATTSAAVTSGSSPQEPAGSKEYVDTTAAADRTEEAPNKSAAAAAEADKKDSAAPATGPGLFGGAAAGFGGFGGFGAAGGFGGTGFGGFAAAAKDSASGGSLFGSYTAPQPGGLFAPVPAFAASRQSKDGDDEGADEAGAEGTEVFGGDNTQPVVQLSEVPKQTGEEDEETVFAADGVLFEFVNGKEWRERGKGELRVNINSTTKQARLVMRQRGSQKLLLNARLYSNMTTSKMVGGKGVTFAAVNAATSTAAGDAAGPEGKEKDSADGEEEQLDAGKEKSTAAQFMRTYALKVKAADKIDEFIAVVDRHKTIPSSGDQAAHVAEENV